jgi:acyl-coenzyme A thioesterase PaaI-like protein
VSGPWIAGLLRPLDEEDVCAPARSGSSGGACCGVIQKYDRYGGLSRVFGDLQQDRPVLGHAGADRVQGEHDFYIIRCEPAKAARMRDESRGDADRIAGRSTTGRTANGCFVCGPENPIGLRVRFRIVDDVCLGEFTPANEHRGYDTMTHGGIMFSLLDDVMANWLWLQGHEAFTARADIRYRGQLPVGTPVRLEGRCSRRRGRLTVMEGRIIRQDTDEIVAESTGSFMLRL